jgi:hypothetical protein
MVKLTLVAVLDETGGDGIDELPPPQATMARASKMATESSRTDLRIYPPWERSEKASWIIREGWAKKKTES